MWTIERYFDVTEVNDGEETKSLNEESNVNDWGNFVFGSFLDSSGVPRLFFYPFHHWIFDLF
jgi:hypothetical protein